MNGFFAAGIIPISVSLIGDLSKGKEKQNRIGAYLGFTFLGQALGTALGGSLTHYFSWRWVFILYGLMELLALIMIYKELMNTDIQGLSTNFISYLKLLKRSKISRLIPLILINGFIVYGSFAYLGSHLREVYGFSYITVGFILSFFGLSAFALGKRSGIMREKMSSFIILFLG